MYIIRERAHNSPSFRFKKIGQTFRNLKVWIQNLNTTSEGLKAGTMEYYVEAFNTAS